METSRCVFVGVGGQGNLLASRLLGEAALSMGIPVVVSEIHGMAQRGGVVESAVLLGNASSPIVSDGEADVLIGFEPLETMRTLTKCSRKTVIITNSSPVPPFTASIGQGVYPPVEDILKILRRKVDKVFAVDGNNIAEKAGNPLSLNMVMLGALIGSGILSINPAALKDTISRSSKKAFLDSNIRAFDMGMEAMGNPH
ncbi:MAG: indolepyruvate oxidoreductase subunit beta [Deltaproteobacteria bacterium]|nr:indolepyruvate oxidoreductase subunit beta [Deltaproteobacteria bacterium]